MTSCTYTLSERELIITAKEIIAVAAKEKEISTAPEENLQTEPAEPNPRTDEVHDVEANPLLLRTSHQKLLRSCLRSIQQRSAQCTIIHMNQKL